MAPNYQKLNNIFGWSSFAVAAFTYISTMEPTASFWDCGEFIATAYKLEVGHPPGAPFFMLMGRFFSLFAFGDPTHAAQMVNLMSALCSAFAILFLFWSITAIAKKISEKSGELTEGKMYAILGSGLVGALAYTFSDTFWFSAVEAEVYAMSSFFTAIVFWCILKWERVADEPQADRWIVLIAYLMGLSIGVHLLNLLVIPAIVFVIYFRKYKPTRKGLIYAGIAAVFITGFIQAGVIPQVVNWAGKFELLFVNNFGLPFNSGLIAYGIFIIALIAFGLVYSMRNNKHALNTGILCFMVLLVGYSSFAVLAIRANANTPMNENNPKDAVSMLSYLNREQYGSWPISYGQYYNAPLDPKNPYSDGNPYYVKDDLNGKYVISDDRKNSIPNYDPRFCTPFPRMYSSQSNHVSGYKRWAEVKGEKISIVNNRGERETVAKPTFGENLKFFKDYQMGWMYFRYFMWNFSGRQNDVQGHGNNMDGNWITGITFIDELLLGEQSKLPSTMLNNKARNTLFALPLLLGLIGMFYHFRADKHYASIVLMLFFFTGIAIHLYLNTPPDQPRERDYASVGSFYAFAIWIGLGVYGLYDALSNKVKMPAKSLAMAVTVVCLLAVPALMASEEWDDHDRSNRYTCRDFARNYLESCAPNAIIFTNGDNDTFPLWYMQEVEGVRTDVRVCNLSLLNTDWYIEQMSRKAYDSDPVPFSMTRDYLTPGPDGSWAKSPLSKYRQGTRDYVPFYENKNVTGHINLREIIDFVSSDEPSNQLETQSGNSINYFPTNKFRVPVDKQKVLQNGTVPARMADRIVDNIDWELRDRGYVLKNDLMVLDLLASFNWDRPVYFAVTTGGDAYMGLEDYFQLEGLAYRLVPIKARPDEQPQGVRVATDIMYKNVMEKFKWGNMDKPGIYIDENINRMATNLRIQMGTLASSLINENKKDSAIKVLDKCLEVTPEANVPYDATMFAVSVCYFQAGAPAKGTMVANKLFDMFEEDLIFYNSMSEKRRSQNGPNIKQAQDVLQKLIYVAQNFNQDALAKDFQQRFIKLGGAAPQQPAMPQMQPQPMPAPAPTGGPSK